MTLEGLKRLLKEYESVTGREPRTIKISCEDEELLKDDLNEYGRFIGSPMEGTWRLEGCQIASDPIMDPGGILILPYHLGYVPEC